MLLTNIWQLDTNRHLATNLYTFHKIWNQLCKMRLFKVHDSNSAKRTLLHYECMYKIHTKRLELLYHKHWLLNYHKWIDFNCLLRLSLRIISKLILICYFVNDTWRIYTYVRVCVWLKSVWLSLISTRGYNLKTIIQHLKGFERNLK